MKIIEVSFGGEHVVEIELVVHFSTNLLSHVGTGGDLSHDVALLLEALWVDLSPSSSSDLGALVNDVSGSIEAALEVGWVLHVEGVAKSSDSLGSSANIVHELITVVLFIALVVDCVPDLTSDRGSSGNGGRAGLKSVCEVAHMIKILKMTITIHIFSNRLLEVHEFIVIWWWGSSSWSGSPVDHSQVHELIIWRWGGSAERDYI